MTRPKNPRSIDFLPGVVYFKPRGIPLRFLEEVNLLVEELEAIRLSDVEGLSQEVCGQRMKVSQPTFHRILESARRKVAAALTGGKAIKIEGGSFDMAPWKFACEDCGYAWEVPWGTGPRKTAITCPQCQSLNIQRTNVPVCAPGHQTQRHPTTVAVRRKGASSSEGVIQG